MNKAQKIAMNFLIVSAIIIAALVVVYLKQPKNYYLCDETNITSDIVFYYGDTCPHCKIVEQFIQDNNISSKLNITKIEVFENKTNGQELIALGSSCRLPSEDIGAVPLLHFEGRAYLGDKDIINFLKIKSGVK